MIDGQIPTKLAKSSEGWGENACGYYPLRLLSLCQQRSPQTLTEDTTTMTTRWIRRSTRTALYNRDEYTCQYCLCSVSPGVQVAPGIVVPAVAGTALATLDHRIPRSLGGDNSRANLTTACLGCNAAKGERTEAEYRASLAPAPVPVTAPITVVGVAIV